MSPLRANALTVSFVTNAGLGSGRAGGGWGSTAPAPDGVRQAIASSAPIVPTSLVFAAAIVPSPCREFEKAVLWPAESLATQNGFGAGKVAQ